VEEVESKIQPQRFHGHGSKPRGEQSAITPDTCAVLVEPIQGEGGVNEAPLDFLRLLRTECDRVGAVLIFDEIQCGLFRTGTMWAHSTYPIDTHPDIITMAKPLANGFPIGAIMVRDKIANHITPGSHGTTFGGSVLATRLGHHVVTRLSAPTFKAHVAAVTNHLDSRLSFLPPFVVEASSEESPSRTLLCPPGLSMPHDLGAFSSRPARTPSALYPVSVSKGQRLTLPWM